MNLFTDLEYKDLYRYDKETNSDKEIIRIEEFARRAKRAISKAQRIEILEVIKEVKTKLDIKTKSVIGIETLLDIMTITSQYRKKDNQEDDSGQSTIDLRF